MIFIAFVAVGAVLLLNQSRLHNLTSHWFTWQSLLKESALNFNYETTEIPRIISRSKHFIPFCLNSIWGWFYWPAQPDLLATQLLCEINELPFCGFASSLILLTCCINITLNVKFLTNRVNMIILETLFGIVNFLELRFGSPLKWQVCQLNLSEEGFMKFDCMQSKTVFTVTIKHLFKEIVMW